MQVKLYILSICLLLMQNIFAQGHDVEYLPCNNCTSANHHLAASVFTYGNSTVYATNHVSSDYGPRDHGSDHYDWHGGIDYSPEAQNEDYGDGILAIVTGDVHTLNLGTAFKYIYLNGTTDDFGYAHLFRSKIGNQRSGNFYIRKVTGTTNVYVVLTQDNRALHTMPGASVTHPSGTILTTVNNVTAGNSVGPIGTSISSGTVYAHLHLYAFENNNFNNGDAHTKNPLDLVNHDSPDFQVKIMDIIQETNTHSHSGVSHNWLRFAPTAEGITLTYPGTTASNILTRAEVNGENSGPNYQNSVFNIERQQLFIKSIDFGNAQSLIQGPFFNSEIIYDGSIDNTESRYMANLATRGEARIGHSGVECWSYSDRRGDPWEYFNFADFVTRIHTNDALADGTTDYTDTPENARYNDGRYEFESKIKNIDNVIFDSDNIEVVIDNFQPFITGFNFEQDDVYRYSVNRIQDEGTTANNNGFVSNQHVGDEVAELAFNPYSLDVTTSEPMQHMLIEWKLESDTDFGDPEFMTKSTSNPLLFTWHAEKELDFECYLFRFSGQDMAGNELMDVFHMTDENSSLDNASIPVRNTSTTWINEDSDHDAEYDYVKLCINIDCSFDGLSTKLWNDNKSVLTGDCDQLDEITHSVIYDCSVDGFVIRLDGVEEGDFDIGWAFEEGEYEPGGIEFSGTEAGNYCYILFNEDECCYLEMCLEVTQQELGSNLDEITFYFTPGPNGTSNMWIDGSNAPLFNTPIFLQLYDANGNSVGGPKILSETSTPSPWVGLEIGAQYCIVYEDAGGCLDEYCFTVEGDSCPDMLSLVLVGLEDTCPEEKTGSISIEVLPTDCPFSISWDNGETGSSISDLGDGTYCVTVQTTELCNNCISVRCYTVGVKPEEECTEPCDEPIVITGDVSPITICNDWLNQISRLIAGSLDYTVSGGSGNYNISVCYVNPFTGVEENLGDLDGFVNVPYHKYGTYCVKVTDDCGNEAKECFDFWQVVYSDKKCLTTKYEFHGEQVEYDISTLEPTLINDLPKPNDEYAGKGGYWSLVRDYFANEDMVFALRSSETDYLHMHLLIHLGKGKAAESAGTDSQDGLSSPNFSMIDVKAQPNPFSESLKLTINNEVKESGLIEIFNINGQKLYEISTSLEVGENIIELSNLPEDIKGALFLKVTTATGTNTIPVIRI